MAVRYGMRWTAVVAVGSLLFSLFVTQASTPYLVLNVAGKTAATAIAAWYVLHGRTLHLRTDDGMRVLGGGLQLALLSALFGIFAMQQGGMLDTADIPEAFVRWALGDMLGIAVVAPTVLLATTSRNREHRLSPFHESSRLRERMFWLALLAPSKTPRDIIAKANAEVQRALQSAEVKERLAKLAGGVAKVNVGAATESEMKEKKARVEDALHATRAAVEEGIVPGGGVALVRSGKALEKLKLDGDQAVGLQIIKRAIEEPMRWIAANAGLEGAVVVHKVREQEWGQGFNAATLTYGDLVEDGVVDPVKVTRFAVANAASIARMVLTTESAVVEKKEEAPEAAGGHGHGHGHRH